MASTTSWSFLDPPNRGYHRSFVTKISSNQWDKYTDCSLHIHYKLSVLAFWDPYELANYRDSYTFYHHGHSNLELPVVAMNSNGSSLLLNVALSGADLEIHVPFHLRYGEPSPDGHQSAEISMPIAFFSCPAAQVSGVDSLPWPTEFTTLSVSDERACLAIQSEPAAAVMISVPVGNPGDFHIVEAGTVLTMVACFCYLVVVFRQTWRRLYYNSGHAKVE
ncbi:hypothetical protein D9758_003983 [Tetrapyrgos nigripes]|uniref:Protein PBN1 n=1 Tax=Tetrapyrgos nigripes TaxID=182062 RepID=A0A8H5LRS7_9AGAR|nr:hypothetical protein D9758_003983 [Tetrapyrgos nigripes]